ncbi:uncharacterized protein [Argopecten irradians]|uniref:uncharacterized protein n=1 Tax=Argopecten irradians TaxID=31199 RepID=UPI003713EF54
MVSNITHSHSSTVNLSPTSCGGLESTTTNNQAYWTTEVSTNTSLSSEDKGSSHGNVASIVVPTLVVCIVVVLVAVFVWRFRKSKKRNNRNTQQSHVGDFSRSENKLTERNTGRIVRAQIPVSDDQSSCDGTRGRGTMEYTSEHENNVYDINSIIELDDNTSDHVLDRSAQVEDEEKKTTSETVYDSVTGMPSGSSTLAGLDVMDDHAPTTSRLDPTFSSEMTSPTQDRTMGSHSTSRTTNICPSRPTTSSVNTDSETTIQTFLPTDGNGNVSNSSSSQVVNVTLGYDSETVYTTSSTVKNISYEATPSGGDDRTTEPVCGTATGSRNSSLIASVVGGTMSFIVICCVILAFYIKIKRKTVKDSDTQRSHSVTVQNSEYEHVYENEVATPKFTTDGTYESVDSHSKYINVQEKSTDAKPRIETSDSSEELYESYKQ